MSLPTIGKWIISRLGIRVSISGAKTQDFSTSRLRSILSSFATILKPCPKQPEHLRDCGLIHATLPNLIIGHYRRSVLMTAVEAGPGPLSLGQSSLIKMEERKRSIAYDQHDSAPPLKKQATAPNGASKPHTGADMPWKDDLEVSSTSFHPPYSFHLRSMLHSDQC